VHWANGETRPLNPGVLVLVRPTDTHGFRAVDPAGFVHSNVAFPAAVLDELRERYFSHQAQFYGGAAALPLHHTLSAYRLKRLVEHAERLTRAPKTSLERDRFLLSLFGELEEDPKPVGKLAMAPEWLRRACEGIRQPQHLAGGTRAFARLAAHCAEHVARETRRHLGVTPTDLVTEARMDYAAQQLETSTSEIVEIAAACGIDNLSHFYKLFKRRFGVTPLHYRLRHQAIVRGETSRKTSVTARPRA
jgi:AraC family cel operon transcriptional repressor